MGTALAASNLFMSCSLTNKYSSTVFCMWHTASVSSLYLRCFVYFWRFLRIIGKSLAIDSNSRWVTYGIFLDSRGSEGEVRRSGSRRDRRRSWCFVNMHSMDLVEDML